MLFFSPKGLVVVAPLPGQHHRIVATVDRADEDHPGIELFQTLLDERGPQASRSIIESLVWSSRFRVHHRVASRFQRGPLFIAGDAAHLHSPAGGQGMNIGIQDAINLAGKLGPVLAGTAHAGLLDAYDTQRRPIAARVVKLTDRLTRIATLTDPRARYARNLFLRALDRLPQAKRRIATNLAELDDRLVAAPAL